ncbi:hypothetical protein [Polyangium sp. 6x1]|uniref:hypothetical protein n=1 Tax=Polyangium sp. 6x1 TaxID=3042689 RepID=UPI0024827185|nr:hypothetical protein [Polyangium sp. 6x1]MDI1451721.1 hypothetical protein [Polyangium sp. 6x1]
MMTRARLMPSLLALLVSTAPGVALAQDVAAAEALFQRGVEEMKQAKYITACPAIAESQRLDPRPGTQFTLAECHALAGKLATAVVAYEDFLRMVAGLPVWQQGKYLDRVRLAEGQKAALGPQVPRLILVYPKDPPAGVRVFRDGTELSWVSVGIPLPVDPGEHVVDLEVPGKPRIERRILLAKGEEKSVDLSEVEPPKQEPPKQELPKPPASAPSLRGVEPAQGGMTGGGKAWLFTVGGLGLAGITMGSITGGLALGEKATVDEYCKNLICDPEGLRALERGRQLSVLGTVGFVVGGAGLLTAVVLWATRPGEKKSGGTGAIQADVITTERGGVVVGLKGVF